MSACKSSSSCTGVTWSEEGIESWNGLVHCFHVRYWSFAWPYRWIPMSTDLTGVALAYDTSCFTYETCTLGTYPDPLPLPSVSSHQAESVCSYYFSPPSGATCFQMVGDGYHRINGLKLEILLQNGNPQFVPGGTKPITFYIDASGSLRIVSKIRNGAIFADNYNAGNWMGFVQEPQSVEVGFSKGTCSINPSTLEVSCSIFGYQGMKIISNDNYGDDRVYVPYFGNDGAMMPAKFKAEYVTCPNYC